MRVHRQFMAGSSRVMPIAFRNHPPDGGAMSTDWEKYSTATDCRQRAKIPTDNAVICMNAGLVRQVPGQTVVHDPMKENRAHTGVHGDKKSDPEVRVRFLQLTVVEIPLEE